MLYYSWAKTSVKTPSPSPVVMWGHLANCRAKEQGLLWETANRSCVHICSLLVAKNNVAGCSLSPSLHGNSYNWRRVCGYEHEAFLTKSSFIDTYCFTREIISRKWNRPSTRQGPIYRAVACFLNIQSLPQPLVSFFGQIFRRLLRRIERKGDGRKGLNLRPRRNAKGTSGCNHS